MPIDFPTYETIINRIRADLAANLPGVDPTIFGSFVRAFADSLGGRAFDINVLQEQLLNEFFPQTASGEFLELWAGYEDITRNPATPSVGSITVTGTSGSIISLNTQYRATSGKLYYTTSALTLSAQSIGISSLTRSGSTVTGTTASDHGFATGIEVTIAGAVETDYNGTYEITVTDTDEFEYTITGTPTTPATGTITVSFDGGTVEIESVDAEEEDPDDPELTVNLDSGAQLSIVTPIAGVDANAFVQYLGVTGGTPVESDDDLRERVFQSRANPVANFNVTAIEKQARSVAGVTRVKVKRITPAIGQVTVLFVRDGDDNIIPDAGEVADVETAVLDILQASSDTSDVFVTAPTPVTTNYTFTAISPDTPTMRTAIENNLIAFYEDEVDFEEDITEDKYRGAIINTIDPDTGDTLASFTLSGPSGDITITTDEIGVLGVVTFP